MNTDPHSEQADNLAVDGLIREYARTGGPGDDEQLVKSVMERIGTASPAKVAAKTKPATAPKGGPERDWPSESPNRRILHRLQIAFKWTLVPLFVASVALVVFHSYADSAHASADKYEKRHRAFDLPEEAPGPALVQELLEVREVRGDLEAWGGFLLGAKRQSKDFLRARLLLVEAHYEFVSRNLANEVYSVNECVPLALCQQAIQVLSTQNESPEKNRWLANAWWVWGQGQFDFAISRRDKNSGESDKIMADAAHSLLNALEKCDSRGGKLELTTGKVPALLAKAIHKGAVRGEKVQVDIGRQGSASIMNRVRRLYPQLTAFEDAGQLVGALCHLLLTDLVHSTSAEEIRVRADICNTLGLHEKNTSDPELLGRAIRNLEVAVQEVEQKGEIKKDRLLALAYGRLLGNLADANLRLGNIPEQRKWGWRALRVFRELSATDRSNTVKLELGWVTSRLLIAEYRSSVREPAVKHQVERLLGALEQDSAALSNFAGFQIGDWEEELIHAINASVSDDATLSVGAKGLLTAVSDARREDAQQFYRSIISDFHDNIGLKSNSEFDAVIKLLK